MGKQSKPPKIAFPNPIFTDIEGSKMADPSYLGLLQGARPPALPPTPWGSL